MEPPLEPMEAEVPEAALLQQQLDYHLAVLRAVPGVTAVADYPNGGVDAIHPNDMNKNGVRLKLHGKLINVHFNAAGIDNKVAAALAAIQKVQSTVGAAVIEEAALSVRQPVMQPAHQSTLTDAEEQWLALVRQPAGAANQATLEQANAALAAHRASAGGTSATQVLFEAQWLKAKLRAATIRMLGQGGGRGGALERGNRLERQPEKRPRTDDKERPSNWDKYKDYTLEKYQELETKEQMARTVLINRSSMAHDLPRGDETRGWRHHWRRSVPGCLRSLAAGSLGAIIFMLAVCAREFDVVDEVGEALGFPPKVDGRHTEMCIYIVGRLREWLCAAKWAHTEEQRQDVHVVLAAAAAQRWLYLIQNE